ncbi:MAG: transglycosylase family protein [Actinomycetota bacterium]|nr:transglycosylase family protein [Actinomycetota bacterium]
MRKLLASMLGLAALGGPVTVALAAEDRDRAPLPSPSEVETEIVRFRAVDQVIERRVRRDERKSEARRRERRAERGGGASPALEAIANCESGGDPSAVAGGGTYRGKYQFSRETWAGVGGSGDPAAASEGEQDRRAATLYARTGSSSWPVCGRG